MRNPLNGLPASIRNSCVLACIPASGSLRDWSSVGAVVSIGSTPRWETRNGVLTYVPDLANTSDCVYAHNVKQDLTANWTWFVSGIKEQVGLAGITNNTLWRKFGAGTRQMFWLHGGAVKAYNGTVTSQYVTSLVGVDSIAVHNSAAGTPAFFINGGFVGNGSSAITFASCTNNVEIDFTNAVGTPSVGHSALLGFDAKLTGAQIGILHAWSEALRTPSKVWPGFGQGYLSRPSQVRVEAGCVGAWDLGQIANGRVPDLSGKGNVGTVTGNVQVVQTPTGKAARFDGVSGLVSCGSIGNAGTLSGGVTLRALVKPKITSVFQYLVGGIYININLSASNKFGGTISGLSPSGVAGLTKTAEQAYLVVFTWDCASLSIYVNGVLEGSVSTTGTPTGLAAGGWYLGCNSTSVSLGIELNGEFSDSELYNRAWTEAEVQADYYRMARLCTFDSFSSDWRVSLADEGGTVGQRISNTPFKCADTGFRARVVDQPSVEGGRALECGTAGFHYVESTIGYGTADFALTHGAGNTTRVFLNSDAASLTNSAYTLEVSATEQVRLLKRTAGVDVVLFATSAAYVVADTPYTFMVARRYDGRFSVYIRGGAYTAWTLVDVAGGSGTNPVTDNTHTTSKYFVVDMDAGDMIANIRRYAGEVLP